MNVNFAYINYLITLQFCPCHDSWAVLAFAKKVIVIALFGLPVIKNCYIEICVIYTSRVMKLVYGLSRQNHNRPSYSADAKPYGVIKLLIYGAI